MYSHEKTVMKSFRLSSRTADLLSKTTKKMNVSESTYISSILDARLKIEPLVQKFNGIGFSETLFQEILAQVNIPGLEILASERARKDIPFVFELLNLELSIPGMIRYFVDVLQPCGWFEVQILRKDEVEEMKLFHNFGIRWSLFLKSYITSAFELVILDYPDISTSERVVKVILPMAARYESPQVYAP